MLDKTDELIISILGANDKISAFGVYSFLEKEGITLSRGILFNRLISLVELGYISLMYEPDNSKISTLFYIEDDDESIK